MADKRELRDALTAKEAELTAAARAESDALLRSQFLAIEQVASAETLLLFAGMGHETDTVPLLKELSRQGKRVCLPCCLPEHRLEARVYQPGRLVRHRFGMEEPSKDCPMIDIREIDLILVPALSYDRARCRLGHGGGYYDRLLADYDGFSVGLCREWLLCDTLPRDPWDRPVSLVVTEREII